MLGWNRRIAPTCDKEFVTRFADNIHRLLKAAKDEAGNKDACFLSGSFVIGDDDRKTFSKKLGVPQKHSYFKNTLGTCRVRPVAWTHTEFMKDEHFQLAKNNPSNSRVVDASQHQEISTAPNIMIQYACDSECRDADHSGKCEERNRVPKRVALWYTFTIEEDLKKNFVFLKFETNPAVSPGHIFEAAHNYYSKHGADRKNSYVTLRF